MNRSTARRIHEFTNITYWAENPGWKSGDPALDFTCKALRMLPFSVHEAQKKAFFDTRKLLAVNGESVVACGDPGRVDKFMFRYPGSMGQEAFRDAVDHEVSALTSYLAHVALQTQVSIKTADIFRLRSMRVDAVAQTQNKLDLATHVPLQLENVQSDFPPALRGRTARDLELLLGGIARMSEDHGYYPDIAGSSGNLRSSQSDGSVTLIDVMPIYADGGRLIDDGANVLPHTLETIGRFEKFIGSYGA